MLHKIICVFVFASCRNHFVMSRIVFMKMVHLSNTLKFEIPDGPIGVSCSGGADSSLLLYILAKSAPDQLHVYTCACHIKGRRNSLVVPRVIDQVIELTGYDRIFSHTWYVKEKSISTVFSPQSAALECGQIKMLFTGVTANPPLDVVKSFSNISYEHDSRDPETDRPLRHIDNICTPFTNIDKKFIAKLYHEYGLERSLLPLTRSCESFESKDFNGHCQKCWWCEERRWAFGDLAFLLPDDKATWFSTHFARRFKRDNKSVNSLDT